MNKTILKPARKYTFSDYFELSSTPAEIVKELGYTMRTESLPGRSANASGPKV